MWEKVLERAQDVVNVVLDEGVSVEEAIELIFGKGFKNWRPEDYEKVLQKVYDMFKNIKVKKGGFIMDNLELVESILDVTESLIGMNKSAIVFGFYHDNLEEGDRVCFKDAPKMCGVIVGKRGKGRGDLEFDIKLDTGGIMRRRPWWEVDLEAVVGVLASVENKEVVFINDRIGLVGEELIKSASVEDLIWEMFDRIAKKCNCEKKALVMIEKAVDDYIERKAVGWEKLPKGWTMESVKKFWNSLTGDVKHKVTKCIELMEDKMDDPEAFCASVKDMVEGTTKWRGRK